MPENRGRCPPVERCDIRFRGGWIARGVDPRKYRWTLNDPAYPSETAGDIVFWQPSL